MDRIKGTTARLRRTFAYPTDDDSSELSTADIMDETEQQAVIQDLADSLAVRNAQLRRILWGLHVLAFTSYLPMTVAARRDDLVIVSLAYSSLAFSAYLLAILPPLETGIPRLDAWASRDVRRAMAEEDRNHRDDDQDEDDDGDDGTRAGLVSQARQIRRGRLASAFHIARHRGPIETWLPLLLPVLCAVLFLASLSAHLRGTAASLPAAVLMGYVPAVIYATVLYFKVDMAGLDPVRVMEALLYENPGA